MKCALPFSLLCIALAGCEPGEVLFQEPGGGGTDIEREVLTIEARVDLADTALADSLGWQDGIPGAEIHYLMNGTADWQTVQTDSSGQVQIERLLPGLYRFYAGRVLNEAEAALVGGKIRAFGDGQTTRIGKNSKVALSLYADRPGGLLINELGMSSPLYWGYLDSRFFEVYNNSESTIFLDGMIFGSSLVWLKETLHTSCAESASWRSDSLGVAARNMIAFPGTGQDYPILPGELKLIAVAAIDHTPVHPSTLDLRHADFEIGSPSIADNPAVPNMIDVGLDPFNSSAGPGMWLSAAFAAYFLAEAVDIGGLAVSYRDHQGREWLRMPRSRLQDVVVVHPIWAQHDMEWPPCDSALHDSFERYEAVLFEIGFALEHPVEETLALERKILRVTPAGRPVLMNTNTSAFDFLPGTRTPGWLP